MRINKYLAAHGYASRREADYFIKNGQVKINGRVAVLGDQVQEGDKVVVGKAVTERLKQLVYLAYNKPVGIVTHSPEQGQQSIADVFKYKTPVSPIGRLDRDSHGLIILSNDGRLTGKLLNPDSNQEKEYIVTVDKPIISNFLKHLAKGVNIEGYVTKKAEVAQLGSKYFSIILTEGKKHQIRRMCAALGYQVTELVRTRIMNIKLGELKEGEARELKGAELKLFLQEAAIL